MPKFSKPLEKEKPMKGKKMPKGGGKKKGC